MDQLSFAESEYQSKKRRTRREIFLARPGQEYPPAVLAGSLYQPADRQ